MAKAIECMVRRAGGRLGCPLRGLRLEKCIRVNCKVSDLLYCRCDSILIINCIVVAAAAAQVAREVGYVRMCVCLRMSQ